MSASGPGLRLLMVEDDHHAQALYGEYVRWPAPGWAEVDVVATLAEARARLLTQTFDCVLLDPGLPDAQGLEAVDALSRIPPAPAVVVLTGAVTPDLVRLSVERGAQDVVLKGDVTPQVLRRIVGHAVTRQQRLNRIATDHAAAIERNASLDEVTSSLPGSLGQPLLRISQSLRHLVATVEDPQALATMMAIAEDADQLGAHLQGLLEHADIVGRRPVYQAVSVSEAVELGCVLLSEEIDATRATVAIDDMPVVWSSAPQLRQVFIHLLRNSLRHARPLVAPEIQVSAQVFGEGVRVMVDDNGPGIPPRHRTDVFLPGVKLGESSGTAAGMGLATCRAVIEHMGGAIWVADSPQGGARLALTLPSLGSFSRASGRLHSVAQ